MKKLSCSDMGVEDCEFIAKGNNDEEVIQRMVMHHKTHHPEEMQDMSEEDMKESMKEKIENE
ncbi:MAG: hypothetical protein US81_C0012G0006 [Parcubacteria group bacterium GW2011_GWE2_38_18]|nr:MAG: hypothetical protein US81_C0012G0006 [Parcubacteria group bacterium GW2011_GWE2_38_18]